jgi:hypothetical protein
MTFDCQFAITQEQFYIWLAICPNHNVMWRCVTFDRTTLDQFQTAEGMWDGARCGHVDGLYLRLQVLVGQAIRWGTGWCGGGRNSCLPVLATASGKRWTPAIADTPSVARKSSTYINMRHLTSHRLLISHCVAWGEGMEARNTLSSDQKRQSDGTRESMRRQTKAGL